MAEKKGDYYMKTISKEYLLLFNTISNTEKLLSQLQAQLVEAQMQAEELFLLGEDDTRESA